MSLFSYGVMKDFHRIKNDNEHQILFNSFFSNKIKILYDMSDISPFAYYNTGQYELYINNDYNTTNEIIPIIKKFKNNPQYYLYCPVCSKKRLYNIYEELSKISSKSVQVININEDEADVYKKDKYWKVTKVSSDYINNIPEQVALEGHRFYAIRRRVNNAKRKNPNISFEILNENNLNDSLTFFKEWMENQGKKYLHPAVGRDIRLFKMYYNDKSGKTFGLLCRDLKKNKIISVYFVSISSSNPKLSTCVCAKSLNNYEDIGYLTYYEAKKISNERGVILENISGAYSKGTKEQKERWNPCFIYKNYSATRR